MAPPILLLGQLLGRAQRLVDGREHHVGEHLHVLGVDRRGVDLDRLDLQVAADLHRHHAAAGGGLDDLVLELLLGGLHVLLHLLDLLQHLLHVRHARLLGHQAPFSLLVARRRSRSRVAAPPGGRLVGDLLGVELLHEALPPTPPR